MQSSTGSGAGRQAVLLPGNGGEPSEPEWTGDNTKGTSSDRSVPPDMVNKKYAEHRAKGKKAPIFKVTLYLEEVFRLARPGKGKLTLNVAEVHQQIREYYDSTKDAGGAVGLMLDVVDKGFDLATATEGIDLGVYTELRNLLADALNILELPENTGFHAGLSKRKMREMMEALDEMGEAE